MNMDIELIEETIPKSLEIFFTSGDGFEFGPQLQLYALLSNMNKSNISISGG